MPECDEAREWKGLTGRLPALRSRSDQTTRPRVRTPRERQGRSQSELKPWRELEDLTLMGTSKVSSRDVATGSDSNTDRSRGVRKGNSQTETAQKRLNSTGTESKRDIRPGERKRSPVADPPDDPPTRKRDEWKARIRTEGDSKAPSASIATSTCRKAGARGKHTRNVGTPSSVRGEEKRLEQSPVNLPEEWMGPKDTASLARYR